jgi:hypothetical protein
LNKIASSLYSPHLAQYDGGTHRASPSSSKWRILVVVSRSRWQYGHVIYRAHGGHIRGLLNDHRFEVSLLILMTAGGDELHSTATGGLPSPNDIPHKEQFKYVERVTLDGSTLAQEAIRITEWIVNHKFDVIYYVGIGVVTGDVLLANNVGIIHLCYAHAIGLIN